tara:strand:+ start:700 stop:1308 length:609 start_codon:yes stop_codon:yes gene_type:complete
MTKKSRRKSKERKARKRLRVVREVLDELITGVEEIVNENDYFNIYKISNSEIDFLIELDTNNVEILNNLHSEKAKREGEFTVVYIRKTKVPDLEPWTVYNDGESRYLVSNPIITDIRNNISTALPDEKIAKFYIQNNMNIINTILYITDPDILNDGVELTEEQKEHRRIRQILDDKNEAFNNRMKVNRSIKKLQERQKIKSI